MNAHTIDFEQAVYEYVDMLYNVAMKLTRDTQYAERLTRRTLIDTAKKHHPNHYAPKHLKSTLLTTLRELYLDDMKWIDSSSNSYNENMAVSLL